MTTLAPARRSRAADAQTRAAVAHLARRAGFGLHADAVDELAADGYEAAVDRVLDDLGRRDEAAEAVAPPAFDTAGYFAARGGDATARQAAADRARRERRELVGWWLRRMVAADRPIREKLTFLWHDHFATSLQKVKIAELAHLQNRTLYDLGAGRFDALVDAVARDPAMLIWLDGRESSGRAPNENFARELFELFTLGLAGAAHHSAGTPAYTEDDVVEAARALTGWRIDPATYAAVLVPRRHDDGEKTVLGQTGRLGLGEVVAAATLHEACAPHVVARLWSRMGRPAEPDDEVVRELAEPFARDLDVTALLRRMFLHPEFLTPATRQALVKTPVEWLVGIARTLRLPLGPRIAEVVAGLGQIPFFPPDVAGWPANEAWLSTASALTRLRASSTLTAQADLTPITTVVARDRPAAAARMVGVEGWGPTTAAALDEVSSDPRTLMILALVAPEHLLA